MKAGINHDFIASIALNKFSSALARHVGRVNRNPIIGAEIYTISNRDVRALQILDCWLDFIDTEEVIPLFAKDEREYKLPSLKEVKWSDEPEYIQRIARYQDLSSLRTPLNSTQYQALFEWLLLRDQRPLLCQVFRQLLFSSGEAARANCSSEALVTMLSFLPEAPFLVTELTGIKEWNVLPRHMLSILIDHSLTILEAIVLCANNAQNLILIPFKDVLSQVPQMSLASLGILVEKISLAVRTPQLAHELFLKCLESQSSRLFIGRPALVRYFVKNMIGVAMEHIEEAAESKP